MRLLTGIIAWKFRRYTVEDIRMLVRMIDWWRGNVGESIVDGGNGSYGGS